MKFSAFAVTVILGAFGVYAQPGMGAGMGPRAGHHRHFEEKADQKEARARGNHMQEIWMNHKLQQELGFTEYQLKSLNDFLDDSSNGMKVAMVRRFQLQDALVEAFQSSTENEKQLKEIQSDWVAAESIWIQSKIQATRFFLSILNPDQKQRFWDLHEKRKAEGAKRKGDQDWSPHSYKHGRD